MALALRLVPVVLSSLLLAAHFFRSAQWVGVAASLLIPWVLLARRTWAVRVTQAFLVGAAGEWAWTAFRIADVRLETGAPWIRMAAILGAVAAVALAGALLLQARGTRERLVRN